ncbi:hypothetical protein J6590_040097 [Homalodisca vitripennis]|nr:hypothetical protein J6590_040097 [Homalodisca vitripennis]
MPEPNSSTYCLKKSRGPALNPATRERGVNKRTRLSSIRYDPRPREELEDLGYWWLLVMEPKRTTIRAYNSPKMRDHKVTMELLLKYVKREEMRVKRKPRFGTSTVAGRIFTMTPCGLRGFPLRDRRSHCGGRDIKKLHMDGRNFRQQMAKEHREVSIANIENS